jgi:hypothetical protein
MRKMVGYKSKKLLAESRESEVRYSLVRLHDGVGDSGPMCQILDPENYQPIEGENRPRIGCGIRVGSYYGRTYDSQDWWQTSPVLEIIEEREDYMKFRTRNSEYVWKVF